MSQDIKNLLDLVLGPVSGLPKVPETASALSCPERTWSYRDLFDDITAVAKILNESGIAPGSLIGVPPQRGANYVIAVLAVMMAGSAFSPLSAEPVGVIPDAILEVSASWLRPLGVPLARVERLSDKQTLGRWLDCSNSAAYVMPTSGSTGAAKATIVSREGLYTVFHSLHARLGDVIPVGAKWANIHAATFGFSMCEILGAFTFGGECQPASRETWEGTHETGSTVACLTASEIVLWRSDREFDQWPSYIILSGEAAHKAPLAEILREVPETTFINTYAITETSGQITADVINISSLPGTVSGDVGVPLPGINVELIDAYGRKLPKSDLVSEGEIVVSGATVALGYLGVPSTGSRFLGEGQTRSFLTGDLGQWTHGGRLKVAGRSNRRFKISGHWLDLDALERGLMGTGLFSEVLATREDEIRSPIAGSAYLSIVASLRGMTPAKQGSLRRLVKEIIGDSTVRIKLTVVSHIPRSVNGKLAPRELPPGDVLAPVGLQGVDIPRPELLPETVWRDLLGDYVNDDDNLFEIGADSLSLAAAATLMGAALGRALSPTFFIQNPTVSMQKIALAEAGLRDSRRHTPQLSLKAMRASRATARRSARGMTRDARENIDG